MGKFFQIITIDPPSTVRLKKGDAGELVITVSQPNGPTEHVVLTIKNLTELILEN